MKPLGAARGWTTAVVAIAAVALVTAGVPASSLPSARPPAPVVLTARTTTDAGAHPDPALDRAIHTEQLEVVAARAEGAVVEADSALRDARGSLDRQLAAVADDRAAITAAGRAVVARRGQLAVALDRAESARRAYREALTGMHRASRSLGLLALDLYVGSSTAQAVTPGQAQLEVDQQSELATVTSAVESERSVAARDATGNGRRLARAESSLRRARAALGYSTTASGTAVGLLAAAEGGVTAARRALLGAGERLHRARVERDLVAAAFNGPEGTSPDPPPTILGRPALDAAQLAGWFTSNGYTALTRASIGQLTRWYIAEGDAEGVRGDLAFAQAVLETGGFTSSDAVSDNNFAGIGHCDTCAHGWKFPSALLGVRAQIQLLRTYAQPGLTAAGLADPPVLAALDPSSQYTEGCCRTWPSLTGVWATDPVYGRSILVLYQDMLSWALAHGG